MVATTDLLKRINFPFAAASSVKSFVADLRWSNSTEDFDQICFNVNKIDLHMAPENLSTEIVYNIARKQWAAYGFDGASDCLKFRQLSFNFS